GKDGVDCVSWPWNGGNHSIEVLETIAPVEIERYEMREDSEGAGRTRGGMGVIKDYRMLTGPVDMQLGADRFKYPAFGLEGGGSSIPEAIVLRSDGHETPLASKGQHTLSEGDVISVRMPGGGGLGRATERDPSLVRRDVRLGYVSRERARTAYGVELTADGAAVDRDATSRLRGSVGSTRP
ncbi:MAG: hydantoinase B/oxoprolinase family protein, partial [Elusimicrobia bacterium]|nr:hydantoinase B/oxoprolinase family protein [Elusimicrobiota bacterium]